MKANKLIERTVKHWSIGGRDVLTPDISKIERCRHTNRKYSEKREAALSTMCPTMKINYFYFDNTNQKRQQFLCFGHNVSRLILDT